MQKLRKLSGLPKLPEPSVLLEYGSSPLIKGLYDFSPRKRFSLLNVFDISSIIHHCNQQAQCNGSIPTNIAFPIE